MKNQVVLSGRLPAFDAKYYPAEGEKKSRLTWAMNVRLSSKNENGYYDEMLVNFTVWGYAADQLNQISSLPKDDQTRKEFSNITVTGKLVPGYKDKTSGEMIVSLNLDVSEFEFTKMLPNNNSNSEVAPQATHAPSPANRPAPGANRAMPGAAPAGRPAPGTGRPAPGMGAPVPGSRGPGRF